ncbi:hypothetical protein POV27_06440 [Aureisphaera galaxeae]|uniref:hypothetical protein n=1 Tax=Aureisphaera galaxeae TaxID=1538023 RepID=UPI002350C05A|nr:hypothetical protein [Aureisphaera galaxeae]MDC8003681.1 hypothetical protein [Aureisphaera galaxeae]
MNRQKFIFGSLLGLGTAIAVPTYFLSTSKNEQSNSAKSEPDQLDIGLIKEFVISGHSDLKLVKEMLNEHPNLINAAYDWGNGDYEQAIEGAIHMGNKEIANYLMTQGARPNIFAFTMLSMTDLVKSIIETYPELLFARGPHGLTLLHHAQVGESKELESYFLQKGLTKRMIKN